MIFKPYILFCVNCLRRLKYNRIFKITYNLGKYYTFKSKYSKLFFGLITKS